MFTSRGHYYSKSLGQFSSHCQELEDMAELIKLKMRTKITPHTCFCTNIPG